LTVNRRLAEGGFAGRVVDAHGEGVAGAHVSAGGIALETDAEGAFTLGPEVAPGSTDAPSEIAAVKEGFLPARRSLAGLSHEECQELVLVLDGAAASIAGTVVSAAGEPVPRAFVWTFDATPFGFVVQRLSDAESFFALPVSMETIAAGESYIQGMSHAADAEGRFELHGLLPRSYALFAMHPETLSVAGPLAIDAGEQKAVLRLRADERSSAVAGRVTNLAGEPFGGVSLAAYRRVADGTGALRDPPFDRAVYTTSAADGTFRFAQLALEETHFVLRSDDGPVVEVELEHEAHPEALALTVPEVRHVRVLLETDPAQASLFGFEDAEGKTLTTTAMAGNVRASAGMHSFSGGSSGLVATDERARFLVLFKDGTDERRVPLTLQRGQVTEIRL